jgi:TonB family protein
MADLRDRIWNIYEAGPAIGQDSRGRTARDDINEWTTEPKLVAELAAARAQAAERAQGGDLTGAAAVLSKADGLRLQQQNRVDLVQGYWESKREFDRQRALWEASLARAPPELATASRARIQGLEKAMISQLTVNSSWKQLAPFVEALREAYNHERMKLVRDAAPSNAGETLASRVRQRPCPPRPPARIETDQPAARPARLIKSELPADVFYPAQARKDGLSGDVRLRFELDSGGCVRRSELLTSSGAPVLDAAAMEWADYADIAAPISHGAPQSSTVSVQVAFLLGEEAAEAGAGGPIAPIRQLGGIELGTTREAVLTTKGRPVATHGSSITYNSVDERHDGLLTLYFSPGVDATRDTVYAIEYMGDSASIPAGLPRLIGATRQSLVKVYGEPIVSESIAAGVERIVFRSGLYAHLDHDRVDTTFGIVDRRTSVASATARILAAIEAP